MSHQLFGAPEVQTIVDTSLFTDVWIFIVVIHTVFLFFLFIYFFLWADPVMSPGLCGHIRQNNVKNH